MYAGGFNFNICKSFGTLQLVPEPFGLRMVYIPVVDGAEDMYDRGYLDLLLPLDVIGALWATSRAFLYAVESPDENIILEGNAEQKRPDVLIKLHRDPARGENGVLSGQEMCWLRLVSGASEMERRRIKLGPRDLLCIEIACQAVSTLASVEGIHEPTLVNPRHAENTND